MTTMTIRIDDNDDGDQDKKEYCAARRWIALHILWQPSHLQPAATGIFEIPQLTVRNLSSSGSCFQFFEVQMILKFFNSGRFDCSRAVLSLLYIQAWRTICNMDKNKTNNKLIFKLQLLTVSIKSLVGNFPLSFTLSAIDRSYNFPSCKLASK